MNSNSVYKISDFDKEFIFNLFLENGCVSSTNRQVVAIANVVKENHDTLTTFNEVIRREFSKCKQTNSKPFALGSLGERQTKGFYENIIRNYTHEEYVKTFKMKKTTVQALTNFIKNFVNPGNIPLDKKIHVFLWFLINNSSYNEVGILFGLHKSTISHIFHEIAFHLTENRNHFVNWPSVEQQNIIRIKVNNRFKFPNCVGFIDTCTFKVRSKSYRKNISHVILLQAVCDESLMFIDVHVGDFGRIKKTKLFKESPLSKELKKNVDFNNHILGDSEYKLKKRLITPFTIEELLTSEEMLFNELHWKARSYIGHAFELLKERFRKLTCIDIVKQKSLQMLIYAACVIHNFILIHEGNSEIKDETVCFDDCVTINTDIAKTAAEKRQFLCNYISYMNTGSV